VSEDCCGKEVSVTTDALKRAALIQRAFRLEWLTVIWMMAETGVAVGAGIAAHSLLLFAFGIDSVIEIVSACVLIWRLSVELRRGRAFSEAAERRASRIAETACLKTFPFRHSPPSIPPSPHQPPAPEHNSESWDEVAHLCNRGSKSATHAMRTRSLRNGVSG
jgi:hypothetical protein